MKVLNTYIVTVKSKGVINNYTTVLYECSNKKWWQFRAEKTWYLLTMSTFGPGTIFYGLNSMMKIQEKEALVLIEDSKINIPF